MPANDSCTGHTSREHPASRNDLTWTSFHGIPRHWPLAYLATFVVLMAWLIHGLEGNGRT